MIITVDFDACSMKPVKLADVAFANLANIFHNIVFGHVSSF